MSANDNSEPLTSRARSHDDQEHEGVAPLRPDPARASSQSPAPSTPTLLPEGYLQARPANFYDNQPQSAALFPGAGANLTAPALGPTAAAFSAPRPTRQGLQQSQPSEPMQPQPPQLPQPGQNPSSEASQGTPTPYIQDRRPANLPMDATVQMPGRSSQNIPIDCTVQMRGRTKDNLRVESGIPWEKSQEPVEEEEKILPLPVPPPPPSSTNNRLPAMQRPGSAEELHSQIQQAASGSYNAAKLDAIPTPRQSVRYKPATPAAEPVQRPKMVDPVSPKKRRTAGAEVHPGQGRPDSRTTPEFQSDEAVESKRVRINPKLLKPAAAAESASEDVEVDTEFMPRRYSSLKSNDSGFSWSELQYLVQFYFREVKSLFVNPHEFFVSHVDDTTLGEPITFMILSGGIACVFMSLSGNIGDAISTLFGTCAYTIIAAIAMHYAMQWMGVSEGELKSCFKIVAYSQAPLLVSWIKLGTVPVGWFCAFLYSMYLCVLGLEQVFEMDRQRAIVIVAVVSVVIRGLLHLIGL